MRARQEMLGLCDRRIVRRVYEEETGAALRELGVVLDVAELGAEEAREADLESLEPGRAAHRFELRRDERAGRAGDVAVVETRIEEQLPYFVGALGRIERGDDVVQR